MSTAPEALQAPERPILRGEQVWLRPLEPSDMEATSLEEADLAHYAEFLQTLES